MVGADAANFGAGVLHTVRHPIDTAASVLKPLWDTSPPGMAINAAEGKPNPISAFAKSAKDTYDELNTNGPQAGPYMLGQNLAAGAGVDAAVGLGGKVLSKFKEAPVSGQNFTPKQAKSHAAVVAEGNGSGDTGYIPKDIADATSSTLRQTAADNPELANVVRKGSPHDAYAAHQAILQKAKSNIDAAHNAALAPVADTPVDMSPIQKAVEPNKYEAEAMTDEDHQAMQELQDMAGKVQTLGGLNEFRQRLSNMDSTLKNPLAPKKSDLLPQAVSKMYGAVRDHYYDSLEDATGQDFQSQKRLEGNIISEMRGASGAAPRLTAAEAKANAPMSMRERAAGVAEGIGGVGSRGPEIPILGPLASKAADAIRGTKLGQIQQHLQRFYSDLPEATPAAPARPQLTAGAPTPPGASSFAVTRPGQPPANTPPAVPSTISPDPMAPSSGAVHPLPPRAGLPQLPAPSGAPDFVTPPPSPPPAVGPEGAVSRTAAPLPPNPQPIPAGRGMIIGPDGVARPVPAGALPPPAPKPVAVRQNNLATPSPQKDSASPTGRDEFMVVPNPKGLVEKGNLPIWDRPTVQNADGTHSSEYSVSFGDDKGREVLVPTVVNGKFLTPDGVKPPEGSVAEKAMFKSAWDHYLKTGENLGKFDNPADADAYAGALHNRGAGAPPPPRIVTLKSGKTVSVGDTVTVDGRTGKVVGVNPQGKLQVDWSK